MRASLSSLSSLSCLMESSLRAIISCLKASFYFIFLSLCLLASCEEHLEFIQSLHGCTIPRVTPTPSIPHPHPVLLGVGVVYCGMGVPTPSIPHQHPVYHTHTQYYWVWVWYTGCGCGCGILWYGCTHTQFTTPTLSIPHPHPVYHTHTRYTTPTHRKAILTHCKSHQTGIYISGTQQRLLEMEELLYPPLSFNTFLLEGGDFSLGAMRESTSSPNPTHNIS